MKSNQGSLNDARDIKKTSLSMHHIVPPSECLDTVGGYYVGCQHSPSSSCVSEPDVDLKVTGRNGTCLEKYTQCEGVEDESRP